MARSRRRLILGNWKMHTSLPAAIALAADIEAVADTCPAVEVGILPPAAWIVSLRGEQGIDARLGIGAQDVSRHADGAHTGDLSITMLAPWCDYILVGHSERRIHHQETDAIVRGKLDAVLTSPCTPVVAIGESLEQREAGDAVAVVEAQLDGALAGRPSSALARVVVAYEPVWAIGTGRSASADDAQTMCAAIRAWIALQDPSVAEGTRILYGGSMKADNAAALLACPDVDGGLVGGASLDAEAFAGIVAAAADLA